jgi:2-keto-4-pentenoate hydratase/2-oxohepta-3-ene-1,7-dioic acid hydratase in catechol pathway
VRLATFTESERTRIGVVVGEEVTDLATAAPELPTEMTDFLAAGSSALDAARRAAAGSSRRLSLADVRLEAPVLRPAKFLGIGLNYTDHIEETGARVPEFPIVFNKQTSCVSAHRDPIHVPRASAAVDYEGELAFIVGKRCRHVPEEAARDVIAGYTIVNDVSVRDWQGRSPTMTLGKSWDTHGPCGPWIVTSDEIGDPHALALETYVDGDLRQQSNTKYLLFDCFKLVATLSTVCTLEPGDIVSTGTPSGVGVAMSPPGFLKPGQTVRIEIERIGTLENPVIDEPSDTVRL